jgi:hypothetical protein
VRTVVSLLLVPGLIGSVSALAALAICSVTSASLSPVGGALLGVLAGITGGKLTEQRAGRPAPFAAGVRGLLGGIAGAAVVLLLQ